MKFGRQRTIGILSYVERASTHPPQLPSGVPSVVRSTLLTSARSYLASSCPTVLVNRKCDIS